ncbi:polymeric immunoglobulin receptor-like [Seriola lalandi dorsalis]|uniref:polymeric immunoglobulin receptor-like n=1 Tax=Seriola lalandi dorsalis TaxID=1841481 RepID=UPI000C6F5ED5|nr:polymeric immunoglobulin receptor-like [Seriola lalandi dorsalis]
MWILRNLLFILRTLSCVSGAAPLIHVSGYEGRDVNVSCPYAGGYESYEKYLCRNDCVALSCVSGAAPLIHVSGYEGRDVKVSCPYGEGYESYEKYLCRNDCGNDDDVLIMTTQANKNKYSISDDINKRVLTTTISDLSSVDAGKYWCGVTRFLKDYYPAEVRLDVVPDSCCDQFTEIHSHEEGSVSIPCPYDSKYQNNLKYICRGRQPSICLQTAVVTSNRKLNGKFTLTGDEESGKFTVTITNLTQKDSGWFLCGVERNNGLGVFSAVKLEVKVSPQTTSTAISIITTEPVTSRSTYITTNPIKGVRVIMSINRSNEEIIVDNIIYNMEEDADMGSIRPQSVLHHDDNPGEDKQTVYQNFTKPEDVWHNHTDS